MEKFDLNVTLPPFLNGGRQFTTDEANESSSKISPPISIIGVFQLKRPRSYPAEKATTTDLNGAVNYGIYRYNDYPNIIRVPTKSAHVNRLTRNPIIQFTSDEVLEWWCDCAIGNGLLGCYSHVASAIWFLSFQRWQLNSRNMPSRNFINYVTDAP
ncbi:unnamed protein product [Rotaria socialis]|uniref:Uncharacterized protein n=1 Tax=Rotaria socialis TaxID=392032 RepID=A0A817YE20_9BILA|nr:unnamed protein product [Rotaria socialis]CAF3405946.1 unnamed protein product [Rotaria socialis]CAF4315393.1 unnamed protein product [Rotaria socialis]CAF4805341.1 unnamed protein product [Rotaria socialis]